MGSGFGGMNARVGVGTWGVAETGGYHSPSWTEGGHFPSCVRALYRREMPAMFRFVCCTGADPEDPCFFPPCSCAGSQRTTACGALFQRAPGPGCLERPWVDEHGDGEAVPAVCYTRGIHTAYDESAPSRWRFS